MTGWRSWLLSWIFPARCCLCGEVITWRAHLCADCRDKAPYILPPVCERCGRQEDDCICGKRRQHFARCVSPFCHEGVVKHGINQLKNEGYACTVEGFADEMAEVLRREYGGIHFDAITGVPLHPADYRERGFNDAELLGRVLSARIGVPYRPLLRKIIRTKPQKELKAIERTGNLLGAFDVVESQALTDQTILLVDDVITTGSTLDECAKMLKIYGVQEVYGVTAAAAVLKKSETDV